MKSYKLLRLDTIFKGDQGRGILTSIISGLIANSLVYYGNNNLNMSIESSTAIFGLLIGNIIGYSADILFAKSGFDIKGQIINNPKFREKISWLCSSFFSKTFFRFWIIVFIDMMLSLTLIKYITGYMDRFTLFQEKKWKNSLIVFGVAVLTFVIYVNPLRFNWAYSTKENPLMNIMILMWFCLSLLIFVNIKQDMLDQEDSKKRNK